MHSERLWFVCVVGALLTIALSEGAVGQIASRPADQWVTTLEGPERVESLRTDVVVARLRLQPGDVVADLGAGTGVFSVPMARAVSPLGKVYAVEIDEDFFDYIRTKAESAGVENVETVLGEFTDPNLPARDVDLAFFHDVLHHVEDRAGYLKSLAQYVKPSGRVAIIDYGAGQGPHREQADLRIAKDQVTRWMADAGFRPAEEHFDVFSDKFFVVYSRQ